MVPPKCETKREATGTLAQMPLERPVNLAHRMKSSRVFPTGRYFPTRFGSMTTWCRGRIMPLQVLISLSPPGAVKVEFVNDLLESKDDVIGHRHYWRSPRSELGVWSVSSFSPSGPWPRQRRRENPPAVHITPNLGITPLHCTVAHKRQAAVSFTLNWARGCGRSTAASSSNMDACR